jgi:hypothetical protein
MKRMLLFGIMLSMVLVIIGALMVFGGYYFYSTSFSSSYTYQATIECNASLSNVTLFLPLPSLHGDSEIADEIERGNITGVPEGWDLALLTSDDGIMLKIHAEQIAPTGVPRTPLPLSEDEENRETAESTAAPGPIRLFVTVASPDAIQTMDPIGNESLLTPAFNRSSAACPFPYPETAAPSCYAYESRVYADYSAEQTSRVSISVEYEGTNTWWSGGWTGNQFREYIATELSGEQKEWISASGFLVSGEGRYTHL